LAMSLKLDCPKCGTKSGGRMVAWRLLQSGDDVEKFEKVFPVSPSRGIETRSGSVMVERETETIHLTEESFEETFRCSRCGNTWTRTEVKRKEARIT